MLIVLTALIGAAGGFFLLPSEHVLASLILAMASGSLLGFFAACTVAMRANPRRDDPDAIPHSLATY
jgi:hypothetical protein